MTSKDPRCARDILNYKRWRGKERKRKREREREKKINRKREMGVDKVRKRGGIVNSNRTV